MPDFSIPIPPSPPNAEEKKRTLTRTEFGQSEYKSDFKSEYSEVPFKDLTERQSAKNSTK